MTSAAALLIRRLIWQTTVIENDKKRIKGLKNFADIRINGFYNFNFMTVPQDSEICFVTPLGFWLASTLRFSGIILYGRILMH